MGTASKIFLFSAISAICILGDAQVSAAEKGLTSMVESFGSSVKSGFSKVSRAVLPKPKPESKNTSDATSLLVKANPSAKLYVAVAETYMANGNLQDAEAMFHKALKITPDHAEALSGLALLKDRQGAYGEAVILYEKAAKAHPDDAKIFNSMGLCHATHGNLKPALSSLQRAVQLQPREVKYRNNIAMVLVEMGRHDEAFAHFRTQYDDPVSHYNLGYLLQKQGENQKALEHFAAAVRINPQFEEARVWLEHLSGQPSPQTPLQQQFHPPVEIGMRTPPTIQPPPAFVQPSPPPIQPPPAFVQPSPAIAQNAMQRTWSAPPPRQAVVQRRETVQYKSIEQRESIAQSQLDALRPPDPPRPVEMENNGTGNSPTGEPQTTIQRLPPVMQSFESAASKPRQPSEQTPPPLVETTAQEKQDPLAPLPPDSASKLPGTAEKTATGEPSAQAAPLPGPAKPSTPPSSGTTRAPMVYPLPPINEYRR